MISLPLVKFSSASAQFDGEKFTWKHVLGGSVVVVVDNFRSDSSSNASPGLISMKVIQGMTVLDVIDLEHLIRIALSEMDTARQQQRQVQEKELPIAALVESPCLALRFHIPDGRIRRVQLKFGNDADFRVALECIRNLGCHITERVKTQQAQPVPTVQGYGTNTVSHRPSTAAASFEDVSRHIESQQSLISQIGREPGSRGSWMQQSSSDRPSTGLSAPAAHIRRSITSPYASLSQSQTFRPPDALELPSSRYATYNPGSSGTSSSGGPMGPHLVPRRQEDDRISMPPPSRLGRSIQSDPVRPFTSDLFSQVDTFERERPATTAFESQEEDPLLKLIPPRRELPFGRPSSVQRENSINSVRTNSRPTSFALELPPLPTPTLASLSSTLVSRAPRSETARPDVYALQEDVVQQTTPNSSANKRSANETEQSAKRQSSSVRPATAKSAIGNGTSRRPTSARPAPKKTNATDIATFAAISSDSGATHTTAHMGASSESVIPRSSPPPASTRQPLAPFNNSDVPSAYANIDSSLTRLSKHVQSATTSNNENLAPYAELPFEERMTIVNDAILGFIADENSIALCEDVYNCWQRIGLGS